ncbi:Smr/MutS family protein [Hydrogenophaga sp.]|uniref:Smr/MutS family protein n=1 Tax=Hydrogenophaga sp. TaxID=1904254 RepID=UPI0019B253A8|nr:Smr/MutS family protein [Hydrogenophaga sp.]MBD3893478.1 DNA mismatch repair protein MutS [Hydrogenophaga sp.]
MKLRSLSELKSLQKVLARQAVAPSPARAQPQGAQPEPVSFPQSVGPVQALTATQRVQRAPPRRSALPLPRPRDPAQVQDAALSDAFEPKALLHDGASLGFVRPGQSPDLLRKLRAGHWNIQRRLDLHGLHSDEARLALHQFIQQAQQHGLRCVQVVHGKGLGSPGGTPVLKLRVPRWLAQKNEVLAFASARPAQGGSGAVLVLLR